MKQTTLKTDISKTNKKWYIIDASDQILGRLATKIADLLRGCHKVDFLPHQDCGDYVVVINCQKIKLTGNKLKDKKYYRHSGYIGNLKEINAEKLLEKNAKELVHKAVKNMLQKNRLASEQIKKMYLFNDANHNQSSHNLIKL